mgnify:CR=1 FL=1
MKEKKIDAYLVATDDFHGSEYVGDYFKCRKYITGFTGSAGTAIITQDMAGLWTDGRYFIQAADQLRDTTIELFKSGEPGVPTVHQFLNDKLEEGMCLGFDGRTVSAREAEELQELLQKKHITFSVNDDLIGEIRKETAQRNKVLITTLTKRMAEDLTDYMAELGIRVKYMHSDIDTMERAEIIRDLRLDVFDVLVGINLLREGLDIPEITLVAILDADKEGFLRSETSLIQTIGRAARNAEGHVIMYADSITDSMRAAIDETNRRREIQQKYNEEHGITPQTIKKAVRDLIAISKAASASEEEFRKDPESMDARELEKLAKELTKKMRQAAAELNFEEAAKLRDRMKEVKQMLLELEKN